MLTLLIPVLLPFNDQSSMMYLTLAIFSSLFITKDEFVHKDYCSKIEHWLHAVLFILHPVTFFCAYFLWINNTGLGFLTLQVSLIGIFLIYQIYQWIKSHETRK